MKRTIYILLPIIALLMLTSCSRTLDDIAKWETTGNHLKLIEALEDNDPSIGIAAAEAIRKGTAVQGLPYDELRPLLDKAGQRLQFQR